MQPLNHGYFSQFLAITPVWDMIETWGFRMDNPCDFPDIPISPHKKFTKPNITQPLKNGDFSQFFGHNSSLGLDKYVGFLRERPGVFTWMTLVTSLIFLYCLTKNLPNQISRNLLKMVIFRNFLATTPVWDLKETWAFRVDDPCDFPDIPVTSQKNYQTKHYATC